jgi:D-3-phosphoglycerate dehydrogenase
MGVVVVADHVFPSLDTERELLEAAGHELRFEANARRPADVIRAAAGADAVLLCYAPMTAEVIGALPECRIIARYGVGVDTVDVEAATRQGILVSNVPDYCVDEVSDHTLALALALLRGVTRFDRAVREGRWSPWDAGPLDRLRGRAFGVVGFGRIGRAVAARAGAFGFRLFATDAYLPADVIRAAGVEPRSLDDLLAEADVVSLHLPLTAESRHLIGADQLARMRPGAILVNTARGPLVDGAALEAALAASRLGGAALDVIETEPPAAGAALVHRPDVVVTPHAAFYSEESLAELRRKTVEQVVAALGGDTPPYAVNAGALAERRR